MVAWQIGDGFECVSETYQESTISPPIVQLFIIPSPLPSENNPRTPAAALLPSLLLSRSTNRLDIGQRCAAGMEVRTFKLLISKYPNEKKQINQR